MAQFDPSNADVEKVLKELSKADATERKRILAAEVNGKKRKTVLEKYGIDADARYDASGRKLYPWEVTGADMADANTQPEESDEARAAREAQLEQDAATATEQLGSSPAGSETAPAASGTVSDAGTTTTTATTSGGAPSGT